MGGECFCYSWTCGPVWAVFIILAAIPRTLHCIESPAVSVGKMNPRGNHWAVGHLMGKKSIESLPELQETNGVYLTPLEAAVVTESDRYWPLMEALMQHKKQKQTMPPTADRLLRLHIGWREDDRDKYLRDVRPASFGFETTRQ